VLSHRRFSRAGVETRRRCGARAFGCELMRVARASSDWWWRRRALLTFAVTGL